MSQSFPSGDFGAGFQPDNMWQAMEQLKSAFEKRLAPRADKGDVRTAVLSLLTEQPMHGSQILREIEERTEGSWKPGAGSVYPILQLLADEGLVSAEESDGRKTYSLTDSGREEAGSVAGSAPWDSAAGGGHGSRLSAIPKAGTKLAQAAAQVNRTGTPEQIQQAAAVLDETRRKLYAILAQG